MTNFERFKQRTFDKYELFYCKKAFEKHKLSVDSSVIRILGTFLYTDEIEQFIQLISKFSYHSKNEFYFPECNREYNYIDSEILNFDQGMKKLSKRILIKKNILLCINRNSGYGNGDNGRFVLSHFPSIYDILIFNYDLKTQGLIYYKKISDIKLIRGDIPVIEISYAPTFV